MKNENTNKNRILQRGAAALLCCTTSLSLLFSPISATSVKASEEVEARGSLINLSVETERRVDKIDYNLPTVSSKNLSSYKTKSLYVNGKQLKESAAVINEIVYVPLRAFTEAVAGKDGYSYKDGTSTVKLPGLVISASNGGYVIYANDRPLFSFSPTVRMANGSVYVPASALERATGIRRWTDIEGKITFGGTYSPLTPAKDFYREDEVYWLSKIISAESSGESLLGQIAVGDVILNRVKSNQFPNTIYGVIFDRKWGVQFSPTADGRIHNTPTFTSVLAAKICLEGISLSDDAIYFLNPKAASSNWIVNNRNYLYTIGNHDFYN